MRERDISQLLAEREGGQCEVRTPAGSIDVLTDRYVYEVKTARQWKAALGQVLAYARAYPDRRPRLYLFGDTGGMTKAAIEEHCRAAGVGVVWHRDEDAPPRQPREPKPVEDTMGLQLTALDARYGIRSIVSLRLPTPQAPIPQDVLETYADESLAVFDGLLDNELTLQVHAAFGGERQVVGRTRSSILGAPVCYQLRLAMRTAHPRMNLSTSLPGVRRHLFALPYAPKELERMNHVRRPIPELQRLIALVLHPAFPWLSVHGEPATAVESAHWRNYGIRQGKNGPVIGGR